MKRHNFSGQRATHGVKKVHRHMGGTGALAANRGGGRMKKGKKMPGQYGTDQITVRNMKIAKIDKENNLLLINGAVPGPNGSCMIIRETNKVGKYDIDPAAIAPAISQQLLHDVVVMYQANARQGTHRTKDRSDVAGTTKK